MEIRRRWGSLRLDSCYYAPNLAPLRVIELSFQCSHDLVPRRNLPNQCLDIPPFPKTAFISDMRQAAKSFGQVEHCDYVQVALQEVGQPATLGMAGILRLAERTPAPTRQPGFDPAMASVNLSGELAEAKVGSLAALSRAKR